MRRILGGILMVGATIVSLLRGNLTGLAILRNPTYVDSFNVFVILIFIFGVFLFIRGNSLKKLD